MMTKGGFHMDQDGATYVYLDFVYQGIKVESLVFGHMVL